MTEQTRIPVAPSLNPAQQDVLDRIGSTDRPTFRDDLRDHLRSELEAALEPLADRIDEPVYLSKHKLSMLHGCEARFVASENEDFEWTVASARGTVAHKAIELWVARRGDPPPLDLVEDAMARLEADGRSISDWLAALGEAERAELVGRVNDFVTTFLDTFPPLKRQWAPVAESRVRADLCDDRITLQGTIDLSLGRVRGNQAGKVIIDLKTGRAVVGHIEDLRFYALLETLRFGIPPRMLVNYYLDAGQARTEDVTEDLLWSTVRRVTDGVERYVDLRTDQREPRRQPSHNCRWCPIAADCAEGTAFLASLDDED
jgi:hypothetical protein